MRASQAVMEMQIKRTIECHFLTSDWRKYEILMTSHISKEWGSKQS